MTSFRRSLSLLQRDRPIQNGESGSDTSPSPKLPRSRAYMVLRCFVNSMVNPVIVLMFLDSMRASFCGFFSQRSSRHMERLKVKGQHWHRGVFHLLVFFLLGIIIGFTPYFSVDVSKNFGLKHKAFSFEEDLTAGNAHHDSGKNEVSLAKLSTYKRNESLGKVAAMEWTGEPSYIPSSTEDTTLVDRKLLIVVTPTYPHSFQAYYLNRLAYTLRNVPPPLLWIVVEMPPQSAETAKTLRETGVMFRHLVCKQNMTNVKDGHVYQRNAALSHIEKHHLDGIVYFADDDRVYSTDLFEQMREIRRFGTWPVAMLSQSKNKVILEGPICNGTEVIGWHSDQIKKISKRFSLDISGFAFNSTILWDPKRWRRPTIEPIRLYDTIKGLLETTLVEQLVEDESQMQGLPSNCSKIMVWHAHMEAPEIFYSPGWLMLKDIEVAIPLP
ncbi:probable beta-1,4-xylosyltransferase IRX9H [Dioscorea cayenensis subsp. rotundata]|uniref:Glycosyltransferases n=1 Tax=Dioscorea cayennensis subsp. rotundata TaxID=55577 RepID=A0AB40B6G2_DIOCR|nr:probable beta-1,4-xylosyltransferase IRX9H [Dioscorea cayenensis subsp. rotundata]XP_039122844.1 probable beta-1,4-xylosyltransferase IRX9H [Dioscorea cayenensis subsp. rotundata]XP_039122846.1 probable beta-1,4-xylosyltransferase IRX9H [Dioscorea cayenensis subsp. rotundata]XP_039122847.1 probable beta-1,4-xylosyltransferase IRX9H [Dioscorea cayenensis subsp. rotundata]XP_039122848.1 probable beta-1,4-xylosyltransferase IRX9H [Dioscorea cayenensis subsp. rotundata]